MFITLRNVMCFQPVARVLLATRMAQNLQPWRLVDERAGPSGLTKQKAAVNVELNGEISQHLYISSSALKLTLRLQACVQDTCITV